MNRKLQKNTLVNSKSVQATVNALTEHGAQPVLPFHLGMTMRMESCILAERYTNPQV